MNKIIDMFIDLINVSKNQQNSLQIIYLIKIKKNYDRSFKILKKKSKIIQQINQVIYLFKYNLLL